MSLADELLTGWAPVMRSVELVSADHGRFEVSLDGRLLFSKKATGRFPKPREVTDLFEKQLGPALQWRKS